MKRPTKPNVRDARAMSHVHRPSRVPQLDMRKRIKGNLYFQGEPGGPEDVSGVENEKQSPPPPAQQSTK